ncbi:MAG: DUF2283 domain-containing protein [Candidatus Kapabacteria bacterium]|nr:DUF2283 domain-containing protein [Candidatus Kapabacteria bacterium]
MRFKYDADVDILVIEFNDQQVADSDEIAPDVILDISVNQEPVRLEILDASKKIDDPSTLTMS